MRILAPIALALALAGCAYPVSTVEQGAAASGLYVRFAPAGATLEVDGAPAGQVVVFDGKKAVYPVAPGKHRVVVRGAGGVVFDKDIYVGAGSKVAVEISR